MTLDTNPDEERFLSYKRPTGFTDSERYLKQLCDKTFLSLWSHSSVFRDQGNWKENANGHPISYKGDGKEVCDLLVVFEDNIIIFSDKDCLYKTTTNPIIDWSRWYKKAILKSAEQIFGAERWIRENPERLFLDKACLLKFPNRLPDMETAKFHRIVIAHGVTERIKEDLGLSGSLIIMPDIAGESHYNNNHIDGVKPYVIGQIAPNKGFVHVLDDVSLSVLMGYRDTISDFVEYLNKKEAFIASGKLQKSIGEENLLAHYMTNISINNEHDFIVPDDMERLTIPAGTWEAYVKSPMQNARARADEVSYGWDRLIEQFTQKYYISNYRGSAIPKFKDTEELLRYMARESRVSRRVLATLHSRTLEEGKGCDSTKCRVFSQSSKQTAFVFMTLKQPRKISYEEYTKVRLRMLVATCGMVKVNHPHVENILGIASEPGLVNGIWSQDTCYMDTKRLTDEDLAKLKLLHERYKLPYRKEATFSIREPEHPNSLLANNIDTSNLQHGGRTSLRNSLCGCGSGLKYKRCCGRYRR